MLNVITGSRSRRLKTDLDYATYLSLDDDNHNKPLSLLYTFSIGINKRFENKLYRDKLPPLLEN